MNTNFTFKIIAFSLSDGRSAKPLKSEAEIMREMPSGLAARALTVASSLLDSANEFIETHSLEIAPPKEGASSRTLSLGKFKFFKLLILFHHQNFRNRNST